MQALNGFTLVGDRLGAQPKDVLDPGPPQLRVEVAKLAGLRGAAPSTRDQVPVATSDASPGQPVHGYQNSTRAPESRPKLTQAPLVAAKSILRQSRVPEVLGGSVIDRKRKAAGRVNKSFAIIISTLNRR
jgi:hypothetical protein